MIVPPDPAWAWLRPYGKFIGRHDFYTFLNVIGQWCLDENRPILECCVENMDELTELLFPGERDEEEEDNEEEEAEQEEEGGDEDMQDNESGDQDADWSEGEVRREAATRHSPRVAAIEPRTRRSSRGSTLAATQAVAAATPLLAASRKRPRSQSPLASTRHTPPKHRRGRRAPASAAAAAIKSAPAATTKAKGSQARQSGRFIAARAVSSPALAADLAFAASAPAPLAPSPAPAAPLPAPLLAVAGSLPVAAPLVPAPVAPVAPAPAPVPAPAPQPAVDPSQPCPLQLAPLSVAPKLLLPLLLPLLHMSCLLHLLTVMLAAVEQFPFPLTLHSSASQIAEYTRLMSVHQDHVHRRMTQIAELAVEIQRAAEPAPPAAAPVVARLGN